MSDQPRFSIRLQSKSATTPNRVRFVCISDTHNRLQEMAHRVPAGDVLLHCGDFTNKGRADEVEAFNNALASLPHQCKIVICGNHEDELTRLHSSEHIATNILTSTTHYLHHEAISLFDDSVRIFGSPFSRFGPATALQHDELSYKWRAIPDRCDILMTHVPCLGIRDLANAAVDGFYWDTAGHDRPPPPPAEWNVPDQIVNGSEHISLMDAIRAKHKVAPVSCKICGELHHMWSHWGCADLLARVRQVQPAVHVFGHVHEQNGAELMENTWHVNAAMDGGGDAIVFDVEFSGQD